MSTAAIDIWTIKCLTGASAGVEYNLATWKITAPVLTRVATGEDQVTFNTVVQDATVDLVFQQFDMAALYHTDPVTSVKTRRFVGVWTRTPATINDRTEAVGYTLSGGPWWWMNNLVFQSEWVSLTEVSESIAVSAIKPYTVIGLAVDGSQSDLAVVVVAALDYCLACAAAQPSGAVVPFALGDLSFTDSVIPYEEVANVTCWQLLQHCLRWCPNVAFTVDYSEPSPGDPPTVTMMPRSSLAATTLTLGSAPFPAINRMTPRNDLIPPSVVIKYDTTNLIDNKPYYMQVVDQYPGGVDERTVRSMVTYVNLAGGHETFEKVMITTQECPISSSDSVALSWAQKQQQWIWAQTNGVTFDYDTALITCTDVKTTIDPNDPAATDPPPGFNINALVEELLTGEIKPWMLLQDGSPGSGYYAAKVSKRVTLLYSGTDPKTLAIFTNNPAGAQNTFVFYVNMKATTASSGTYQRETSAQSSEPPPSGLALALWTARQQLHFDGEIEYYENECSGLVNITNVLNLAGGRTEWSTMGAMIQRIVEDIDSGKTTITIGPPTVLGVNEMMDLLRCFRLRAPAWNLDNTTGSADQDTVNGHTHAHHTSHVVPLGYHQSTGLGAWGDSIVFRQIGGVWQINVQRGRIGTSNADADQLLGAAAPTGLNSWGSISAADTGVVLKGTVVGLVTTASEVDVDSSGFTIGTAWTSGGIVEGDGATPQNQSSWLIPIAKIDWSSGSPIATWIINSNLITRMGPYADSSGNVSAAIYPQAA